MTRAVKLADVPPDVRAKLAPKRTRATPNKITQHLRAATEAMRRDEFTAMLRRARLPIPTPEHRFHATRLWKFDYAWVEQKVALEVEGGAWTQGRHTRGKGFIADLTKYSEAALDGWIVLRVVPDTLTSKTTETWIRRALKRRENAGENV